MRDAGPADQPRGKYPAALIGLRPAEPSRPPGGHCQPASEPGTPYQIDFGNGVLLLLEVQNLSVAYSRSTPTLRGVSLCVQAGETVALTGGSGAGKSTLAWSILQVLPPDTTQTGSIRFDGVELMGQSAATLRALRGRAVACIPQQPALALHPLIRVGRQVENVLKSHGLYSAGGRNRILSLFHQAGLSEHCFDRYPHQLSGGQLQRAAIVQALVCRPRLVIADEPFAALDTVTRREILRLFQEVKQSLALSLLLISHDRQVVSAVADRVLALRDGKASEPFSEARLAE